MLREFVIQIIRLPQYGRHRLTISPFGTLILFDLQRPTTSDVNDSMLSVVLSDFAK
jgi:hypothetical protein